MDTRRTRVVLDLERLRFINCGLGRFCLNLTRALLEPASRAVAGIDPVLFMPKTAARHLEPLVSALSIPRLPVTVFRKERVIKWLRPLVRPFLGPPRVDLWHVTHQLSKYLPLDARVPVVLTIHDLNFLHESEQQESPERIARKLAAIQRRVDRANAIVTVSQFTADDVKTHLDVRDTPIHVIPNGMTPATPSSPERPAFLLPGPFLLSVGNFLWHKNFHVLLRLLGELPTRRLVLAGKRATPYGRFLHDEIRRVGLEDRVVMPGEVSDGDRQWLYEHCEAFLFPSLAEGFGFPVLEAMQMGKPVFCSRRTSLPEVAAGHGFFFDSFESQAMLDVFHRGMAEVHRTPDFATRVAKHAAGYSWEVTARGYRQVYDSVIDAASAGSQGRRPLRPHDAAPRAA